MLSYNVITRLYLLSSILLFSFVSLHTHAGQVIDSHVKYEDGHYLLNLDMLVEAPVNEVYQVLMDANNLDQVNESIKLSRLLDSKASQHRVYLEAEGCIWFFCRRVKQIQLVTDMGRGYIMSETQPQQSDFEYGKVLWQLQNQDNLTRVNYSADFVPDFWIPPLIGPWLFGKRLLDEGKKTINGIEIRAKQL